MIRIIILTISMIFAMDFLCAQSIRFLSDRHVMKHLSTNAKYLLLPVEEKQENDHVRVIQNHKVVKEFKCKLAMHKEDYFVPLCLAEFAGDDILLDINMSCNNICNQIPLRDFATVTKAPTRGKIRMLQIFIDRSSIEVFDADGKMSMTNIVFPSSPYNKITVKGGRAQIYSLLAKPKN